MIIHGDEGSSNVNQYGGRRIEIKKVGKGKRRNSHKSRQQIELEEIELMIAAGKKKRYEDIVAMRERQKEYTIMSMNTTSFTPRTKAYWKGKRREIIRKQVPKILFEDLPDVGDATQQI
ncbi:hypothetical protein MIMGU_mgv1a016518mg [Erythranthe guttata]|uniref:Uncharacterized protein n=1 Tax=Erythranthe guttata TaxID=4155 RepID=A0A022R1S7_ERYGU|nr:hypothetical protein MIMGU_mgv1a016518mg [Erythranthe guttata]